MKIPDTFSKKSSRLSVVSTSLTGILKRLGLNTNAPISPNVVRIIMFHDGCLMKAEKIKYLVQ